jgi:hypothetical protein
MTPEEKERAIKAVFGITDDHPNFRPPQPPPPAEKPSAAENPPMEGAAPPALSPSQPLSSTHLPHGSHGSAPTLKGDTDSCENRPPNEPPPTPPSPRNPPPIPSAGPHWPSTTRPVLPPGGCYHFSSTSAFPFA